MLSLSAARKIFSASRPSRYCVRNRQSRPTRSDDPTAVDATSSGDSSTGRESSSDCPPACNIALAFSARRLLTWIADLAGNDGDDIASLLPHVKEAAVEDEESNARANRPKAGSALQVRLDKRTLHCKANLTLHRKAFPVHRGRVDDLP
jgi:hypothetical protein